MQKQDELGVKFEKYQVFAKLAVGGMAELFLAKQPGIGGFRKTVVLKCILPHLANEDDFVTMFLDEARVVAPLDHPNIVQIYDIGEAGGVYYIAMEYIRGQTLKEFRKKLYQQNPEVKPYKLSAGIIAQAAAGLHQAHVARDDDGVPLQLVHRDVSPTNLISSYNGMVKLVDFGVAKASNQQHRTSAGTIKGKYRYMSPEQIRGQELDARSDVFSLGIVLYELSTNAALFGRRHEAEIIDAVRNARVPEPSKFRPDYPPELERIVLKALAQDREERYQSADALRSDLEAYMREDGGYYGTTQLAELMQFLFSKEQSEDRTGVTHRPLSPADFVRFLGEFPDANAMAAYTNGSSSGSYSDPKGRSSGPKGRGSEQSWPENSQANHTPQPSSPLRGGGSTANHRARLTPPPATASPFAGGPRPPGTPPGPRAAPTGRPAAPRTELSMAAPSDAFDEFGEIDATPIQSMAVEDPYNADLPPIDPDTEDEPRRKGGWLLVLLILLLAGGAAGVYFGLRNTTPTLDFAKEQRTIEARLSSRQYLEARNQLRKLAKETLTPDQTGWVKQAQKRAAVGPQIDMAEQLFRQEEYQACLKILHQVQPKAPQDPRLAKLLAKTQKALLAPAPRPFQPDRPRPRPVVPRRVVVRPPPPRRRRYRRRRRRSRPRTRRRLVAMAVRRPKPRVRPARLTLRARPRSQVRLNGKNLGRTPIRNRKVAPGTYRATFSLDGYTSVTRTIRVRRGQTKDLDVSLQRIPVVRRRPRVRPPVQVRARPRPTGPQARYPFAKVRLPRSKRLRIYVSDPRGLGGRHSTLQLRKLARQIERETTRLLGGNFRVSGITRAWQRTVRSRATQRNQDYHTFYPRAVAYIIYKNLLRGRSPKRVAQVLIKYEYRNRFKRIRN